MKCPSCQADNRDGAKFCIGCGSPLPLPFTCPVCGKASTSTKFCTHCGHKFGEAPQSPLIAPEPPKPEPKPEGGGDSRLTKIVVILVVVLIALAAAAYVFLRPANPEPTVEPVSAESALAPTPVVQPPATKPPLAQPPVAEPLSSPSPILEAPLTTPDPSIKAAPAPRPQIKPLPKTKPMGARTAPAEPARPLVAPSPLPAPAPEPQRRLEAQKQFSCGDLPFGLRLACGLEGKDVIRKCAPDLKSWNHDLPGCNRQSSTSTP